MFGLSSLASQILQGSTRRTWHRVSYFAHLVWSKVFHIGSNTMPRSRKRHHSRSKSRSRSRSRSQSRDRSCERHRRDSHEKEGKRRKIDGVESPQNRSLSPVEEVPTVQPRETIGVQEIVEEPSSCNEEPALTISQSENGSKCPSKEDENVDEVQLALENDSSTNLDQSSQESDSETSKKEDCETPKRKTLSISANKDKRASSNKPLTPKQLQKQAEYEKRRQEKDKQLRQKQEERAKIQEEKLKAKQQKDEERQKQIEEKRKQLEQKQKEKEMKEEQRKKEKEEKERKRKEKEELEEQKRKEKELEKLKKQQEIEEKEKEKQKEEQKKQKTAKLFVNFFKKDNPTQDERKVEKIVLTTSNFMPFEVKSDMKLPPLRRQPLSEVEIENLESVIENQDDNASYLKDLKNGRMITRRSGKTWPVEDDVEDDDVTIVEDKGLGETICEDTSTSKKMRAKFLCFHENRRPAYFGTWKKKSKFVRPRKPFGEDKEVFNYEEDSDDDWEEEEQGESLDVSDDEADKETEEEKDEYEVDNEFFVPHGHLSDDEMNDEENSRMSPESMKQKLKLLKDEFDEDMKLKTHKLKPRSIGCIWYNKAGDNVEEAIQRYLQPFAAIVNGQVEIKKRSEIFNTATPGERKKHRITQELPQEHIPLFLNIIEGNPNNQKALVEQFITYMTNNGMQVEVSKTNLIRYLKKCARYQKWKAPGPMKNKSGWFLNEDVKEKYNITLSEKSD